jgi:hypothetical protein
MSSFLFMENFLLRFFEINRIFMANIIFTQKILINLFIILLQNIFSLITKFYRYFDINSDILKILLT